VIDDKIKKYFLGELAEAEAEILEQEVAEDENLFELAGIVEDELIDDYVREDLSSSEKLLFEANYLTTQARFEKVNFARFFPDSIKNYSPEPPVEKEQKSFRQTVFAGFKLYKAFAFVFLAVLAMSVGLAIWLNSQNKPEIARQAESNQTPLPPVERGIEPTNSGIVNSGLKTNVNLAPKSANPQKPTPTPEIKSTPAPNPAPKIIEPLKPMSASFMLLPGTLRSSGEQSVEISSATNKVNFRLTLPKDSAKYQSYNATLKTAAGETIFIASKLKSLNLTLAANKLKNETYIIFLEGNSTATTAESVAEYTFRVQRRKTI
jgi:hypothetical protein